MSDEPEGIDGNPEYRDIGDSRQLDDIDRIAAERELEIFGDPSKGRSSQAQESSVDERGWGRSEQHLLPDAMVAFVDGEMSQTAHDRAAAHMARCPQCLADVIAQRQAASADQTTAGPVVPAALLASLRSIPNQVDMPSTPDGLAVTDDGELVAVQKPDQFGAIPRGIDITVARPDDIRYYSTLGRGIDRTTEIVGRILNWFGPPPEPLPTGVSTPPNLPAGVS